MEPASAQDTAGTRDPNDALADSGHADVLRRHERDYADATGKSTEAIATIKRNEPL